ncbi:MULTISPECIES: glycosyltransferase family 61 protein [unclassified Yoonia]|uniref:glycosyltransferase family 61 protein n=1 Tax=unclassified Yoonia TaxID=2629118 RepID=UPI002B0020A9|nr:MULTISPECIES: glycosyltransferase family 61 protein [unclassified Yoonia]
MKTFKNAFLLPGHQIDRLTTGFGVYDADGALLPDCAIRTTPWTTRAPDRAAAQRNATMVLGPALFAGSVDKQFGFVLLNSLGRLWALDALPRETVIVYGEKPMPRSPNYGFVSMILRSLGVLNPVVITQGALRFETLHSAEERFGECLGGTGRPAFYDWIDSRWPAKALPDPNRKVYVTRSGLGAAMGRYACEEHLETLLADEGYEIYRPEAHSLAHQIATFQAAEKLIFAEGSAVHLFALIRQPGQLSAVIHRRAVLPDVMLAQMADRPGSPTIAINAISALWWPPRRGGHLGLSVLDFTALRDGLTRLGLISGMGWHGPTQAQLDRSLTAGLSPDEELMDTGQRNKWLKQRRDARRKG